MEILVKIILCSGIFIGFYRLVLQSEKMFVFNRIYLVLTLVLSIAIPFMEFGIAAIDEVPKVENMIPTELAKQEILLKSAVENEAKNSMNPIPVQEFTPKQNREPTSFAFNYWLLVPMVYFLIAGILFCRLIFNLAQMFWLIFKSDKLKKKGFTLVKLNRQTGTFSFFNYLFVSKSELSEDRVQPEIFRHERAHMRQKHSWDIIFLEILRVIFWFNPFLHFYKKSIQINHEFLADEAVLSIHFDSANYKYLLLNAISQQSATQLASSFNYVVTKKRLIMMTKQSSQMKTRAFKFLCIPFLIGTMLLFSHKVTAQIGNEGKGVSTEMFREYKKQIRKATVTVTDKNGQKRKEVDLSKLDRKLMGEIYAQMTPEQKLKTTAVQSVSTPQIIVNGKEINFDIPSNDWAYGIDAADLGLKIVGDVFSEMDLEDLNLSYFNSPEWHAQIAKIEANAAELERHYNSPEFKNQIEMAERNAAEVERLYNSPKFKAQFEKIEKNAAEIERYFNSPEFKAQIEKVEKNAADLERYYNSPEFKNQIYEIEKNAAELERYYNSPEWKEQIEKIEKQAEETAKKALKAAKKAEEEANK